MIKLLRRRLREYSPELVQTTQLPARLQRTQDMLKEIWVRAGGAGDRHPIWRLVEGLLRMASEPMGAERAEPDQQDQIGQDQMS